MELRGSTVLLLGGAGLVGQAIARRLLTHEPRRVVIVSLTEHEVHHAVEALAPYRGESAVEGEWGNVFVPSQVAQIGRQAVLADPGLRDLVIGDLLGELSPEVLDRSFLMRLFRRFQPQAVVDCINTATAFAYQDIFQSARQLLAAARAGEVGRELAEQHILTITMPQLIRHVQIILEAMRENHTQAYVKIGTSGTGGMGLNIPYTHSEERPSRTLLTKSAVAGAHSLLLFLVGRTPGAPATVEIKPTAAIAWREIAFGPVKRSGQPIPLFDCPEPLPLERAFAPGAAGWVETGSSLESVYIDLGENGLFARDEFETVTALGSMEFITPEEIADYVLLELGGRATGRDIIAALDAATAGPTYRAGWLRARAIERLRDLESEHGVRSVAFEMLGPPRLTKLLHEAHIWSRVRVSVSELAASKAEALSEEGARLVSTDVKLRSLLVSVGLPILLPDRTVYRGRAVIVPPSGGPVDDAARRGWVDLRRENCAGWIARARRVVEQAADRHRRPEGSGSQVDWEAIEPKDPIVPSRFAAWVFRHEEGGERMKR